MLTGGAQAGEGLDGGRGRALPGELESAYVEHGFGGAYYTDVDDLDLVTESVLNDGCTLYELNSWTQAGTARMVRKDRYKLIYDRGGTGELYDLETDPAELQNRYEEPALAAVRAELMADLQRWTLATEDPLPHPRRPYYFKDRRTQRIEPPSE